MPSGGVICLSLNRFFINRTMEDKFLVSVEDDDDGLTICLEWDGNDPSLQWWSSLPKEQQEKTFSAMFMQAINETIDNHSPNESS